MPSIKKVKRETNCETFLLTYFTRGIRLNLQSENTRNKLSELKKHGTDDG